MRHTPSGCTSDGQVLSFRDALKESLLPQEGYDSAKWLYVPCSYGEYRYILGTVGHDPLICIGINPSTAAPDALDPTLKSVQRTALSSGFDSFIMFNLYAQRATDPDAMERACNPFLHENNLDAFEYVLQSVEGKPTVWAAWGAIIEKRAYLFDCLRDMAALAEKYGARWCTCGKRSKSGHPHHPLYLKNGLPLEDFDVLAYCRSFAPGGKELQDQ